MGKGRGGAKGADTGVVRRRVACGGPAPAPADCRCLQGNYPLHACEPQRPGSLATPEGTGHPQSTCRYAQEHPKFPYTCPSVPSRAQPASDTCWNLEHEILTGSSLGAEQGYSQSMSMPAAPKRVIHDLTLFTNLARLSALEAILLKYSEGKFQPPTDITTLFEVRFILGSVQRLSLGPWSPEQRWCSFR